MATGFLARLVTPAVSRAQERFYGRAQPVAELTDDPLTEEEIEFISARDSFYLGTVSENNWPYLQHRGGPKGFLKVLSPSELAFVDIKGNRQMLSVGNISANDKVCLFLIDYAHRHRLKVLGHAEILDVKGNEDLLSRLAPAELCSKVERIFKIRIASYDWNCPQHITERFDREELKGLVAPLEARIAELEAQLTERK